MYRNPFVKTTPLLFYSDPFHLCTMASIIAECYCDRASLFLSSGAHIVFTLSWVCSMPTFVYLRLFYAKPWMAWDKSLWKLISFVVLIQQIFSLLDDRRLLWFGDLLFNGSSIENFIPTTLFLQMVAMNTCSNTNC